jgi:hypothetical protein
MVIDWFVVGLLLLAAVPKALAFWMLIFSCEDSAKSGTRVSAKGETR